MVLTLTVAKRGEAAEGSRRAYCFGGSVFSAETFATGEVNIFLGTGFSMVVGLRRGVDDALLLAAAVFIFRSAFATFIGCGRFPVTHFLVWCKTVNLIR